MGDTQSGIRALRIGKVLRGEGSSSDQCVSSGSDRLIDRSSWVAGVEIKGLASIHFTCSNPFKSNTGHICFVFYKIHSQRLRDVLTYSKTKNTKARHRYEQHEWKDPHLCSRGAAINQAKVPGKRNAGGKCTRY